MLKEKLEEKYKELFTPQIIFRGRDYYTNDKVIDVFKDKDSEQYVAKVKGSDYGVSYDVQLLLDDIENPKMSCTCPCLETCKHEYAVLMSIDNNNYSTIKLLPVPEEEKISIKDFINSIPEDKIKEYLKNSFEIDQYISENDFKDFFSCYLPEKSREYLYNTLYNNFQFNNVNLTKFLNLAKSALENGKYNYTFLILSSIIDSAKESGYTDDKELLLDNYNKIGTFIRIAYRKGTDELKLEIEQWIQKYNNKNFYNDIYLEDMMMSIK